LPVFELDGLRGELAGAPALGLGVDPGGLQRAGCSAGAGLAAAKWPPPIGVGVWGGTAAGAGLAAVSAGAGRRAGVLLGLWLGVAWLGLRAGDLLEAVRTQDSLWTQTLLLTGSEANEVATTSFSRGQPVLYEALFRADPDAEIVALLLQHGADPNGRWLREDGTLIQPVAFALAGYQRAQLRTPVLRLLLQAGLNPCLPDQHGQTLRAALTAFGPTLLADSTALARAEERFGCR